MNILNEFDLQLTILSSLLVLAFISLIIFILKNKKLNRLQNQSSTIEGLLDAFDSTSTIDHNLAKLLGIIESVIEAPSYAFYIIDSKSHQYVLKAAKHRVNQIGDISPSYSGLMPYKKETYLMPAYLPPNIVLDKTRLYKQGEVPLVLMPIEGKKGVVVIGPTSKLERKKQNLLQLLSEKTQPILEALIEMEELKNKVKRVESSGNAVKNMSTFFADLRFVLEMIMNISIKSINAVGGFFLSETHGKYQIETILGLEEDSQKLLFNDTQTHTLFHQLLGNQNFITITKKDKDFFRIPPYFIAAEVEVLILVKVITERGIGIAAFWYDNNLNIKEYQITALQLMANRIGDVINNHRKFQELSYSYIDILKLLAKLVDNLRKNTVGYSELMYRYAVIISKEMNLDSEQTKEIATAAYLSNIGIIGLSDELLNKKGKYSEVEYEKMKLHAEAGASIIEATIGNNRIASYIRHHHERIDGYGYPAGLQGEEIPLGAKIIAVVQTFLAKILSREYRTAVPFEQALKQLRTSTETQLDSKVVEALIRWFDRKRKEALFNNGPLGPCWAMRCSPENVCIHCPGYKNTSQKCWEIEGVNCKEHGSSCESCFIYTEYLDRLKLR